MQEKDCTSRRGGAGEETRRQHATWQLTAYLHTSACEAQGGGCIFVQFMISSYSQKKVPDQLCYHYAAC